MHKAAQGRQPTTQFVGMTGSYPDSVHDLLCYEDPLSDSSSTGDNNLEGTSAPPRVCTMANAPIVDPPPEVVPSQQTRTPSDHHEPAIANAQAHGEDLRLRRQHTPPPVDQPPQAPFGSKGVNPAGSAR